MTDQEAVNTKAFAHFDEKLRKIVDEQYDFCLYKCNEKAAGNLNCKNDCVRSVIVPYKF